ncbi:MAG: sugar ABC transporter permease [Eubacteriales bacterium]|nr:sugar ABC transporter permease [Eubacteriales bacterium]
MNKSSFKKFWKANNGYAYLSVWLIGFFAFKFYPFLSSLYYSLTNYNLFKGGTQFVGLQNYQSIIDTAKYVKSFAVTFKYAFMTVPLKLLFALFIAYILNFKLKGINMFRTIYYIPSILGGSVSIAVLWQFLFQNEGLVNMVIKIFGGEPVNWLGSSDHALFVICLLRVWQFGSAMVIFLAALKGVPEDLYEAASIDGAGKFIQFIKVTVPMITPVVFFNLITQLCQAFQEFNGPFIITNGGPQGSTTLISILIYQNAFKTYKMGLASAMAWMLFLIVATMTAVSFISQKYWVYYGDEER